MTTYVRYRAVAPNARGHRPGVFALVNGLASDGLLSESEDAWRRTANDELTALYPDPSRVDPLVYDRAHHPGAASWFRAGAAHLLDRMGDYCALLDRHGVAWERIETDDPGVILYSDDVQIVAEDGDAT
jgi:hypothetical protein